MRFSFTKEELQSGYLPYDGRFLVRLSKIEYKTSQAGNQVAHITFQGVGPDEGQKGMEMITLTPTVKWKVANLMKACGFDEEYLMSGDADLNHCEGKILVLVRKKTGTETYNGKERTKWEARFERATPEAIQEAGGHEDLGSSGIPDFGSDDVS